MKCFKVKHAVKVAIETSLGTFSFHTAGFTSNIGDTCIRQLIQLFLKEFEIKSRFKDDYCCYHDHHYY